MTIPKRNGLKQTPLKRTKPLKVSYLTKPHIPKRKQFENVEPQHKIAWLSHKTPPKPRKKALHWISPVRVRQLNSEVEVRKQLCYRAGGLPVLHTRNIRIHNGDTCELTTVVCLGGKCEVCGKTGLQLFPHEWPPRARGTKVSLEASKMVCPDCHIKVQKSSPMWSKNKDSEPT